MVSCISNSAFTARLKCVGVNGPGGKEICGASTHEHRHVLSFPKAARRQTENQYLIVPQRKRIFIKFHLMARQGVDVLAYSLPRWWLKKCDFNAVAGLSGFSLLFSNLECSSIPFYDCSLLLHIFRERKTSLYLILWIFRFASICLFSHSNFHLQRGKR